MVQLEIRRGRLIDLLPVTPCQLIRAVEPLSASGEEEGVGD